MFSQASAMPTRFRSSPEVALIAACCRWPRSVECDGEIRRLVADPINWQRFLKLARKHRVEGFIYDRLLVSKTEVPSPVLKDLRGRSLQIAVQSLTMACATVAIYDQFRAAGIAALSIKGSSIEMLAYGKLGLKSAHDIDMIVGRGDLIPACNILTAAGWKRMKPHQGVTGDLLELYFDHVKDALFINEVQGISLELHHGLSSNQALDGVGARSLNQNVEILPNKVVRTLAREELFLYLSVHGAHHIWSRMKWLADLAGMLSHWSPEEIEQTHHAACARGAGLFSGHALLLCHWLLSMPLSKELVAELTENRAYCRLAHASLREMESAEINPHGLKDKFSEFFREIQLGVTWGARIKLLRRHLVSPADLVMFPLPKLLFFLYNFGRVPMFFTRQVLTPIKKRVMGSRPSTPRGNANSEILP
jgi:hypothetical protein